MLLVCACGCHVWRRHTKTSVDFSLLYSHVRSGPMSWWPANQRSRVESYALGAGDIKVVLFWYKASHWILMSEIRVCTLLWKCLLRQRRCISNTQGSFLERATRPGALKFQMKHWNLVSRVICRIRSAKAQLDDPLGLEKWPILRMFTSLYENICESDLPTYTIFGIDV